MSAVSRTVQAGSSTRQLGSMAFALLLTAAVLALLAYGQFSASRQATSPATVTTPVVHDHGWSSDSSADSAGAWTVDPNSAAIDAARHPSKGSITVTPKGIVVTGAQGGGILYNGIPYAARDDSPAGGSGGPTRGRLIR